MGPARKTQECRLEISAKASCLASDGSQVIHERDGSFDFSKDTFFTSQPLWLGQGQGQGSGLELEVTGAGVLRFGLLTEQPQNEYFAQDAVFETEDGFGPGTSQRRLYVNQIGYLCYSGPEADREMLPLGESSLYLYVVVVYGRPVVSAKLDGRSLAWSTFEDSNIGLEGSSTKAHCGLISVAECCMIKEPITTGHTYLLRWKMGLARETVANRTPEHGYIRVAMVTKKPASIANMDIGSGNPDVAWCTESAIDSYPYSGTLAVHMDQSKTTVTHNVLKTSVGETVKQVGAGVAVTDSLYLVVEMSHGSLTVSHGENIDVMQPPGSVFFVKNYTEFASEGALYFDIARHGWEPCKLQYGVDPTSFVVEFREQLLPPDISKLTKGLAKGIKLLKETVMVQVLGVPESFTEFDLNLFFSRAEACGGDNIKTLRKDKATQNAWVITYDSATVARRVFSKSEYSIEGYQVTVLPYYQDLGCSVNRGKKPVLKTEPFAISTDGIDGDKVRFARSREDEMSKLKLYVKNKAGALVSWLDDEMSGQDFDDDEDDVLWAECSLSAVDHQRLADWQNNTRAAVTKYFADGMVETRVHIEPAKWDNAMSLLENFAKSMSFDYMPNKREHSIKIVSSSSNVVTKVQNGIGRAKSATEQGSFKLTGTKAEKFIALDAEGPAHQLAKQYHEIRYTLDRARLDVNITGPKYVVDKLVKDLQTAMLLVRDVSVQVSPECAQIAKDNTHDLSNELSKLGLNNNLKISKAAVSVLTVVEKETLLKKKQELMLRAISNVIKEEKVPVDDSMKNELWRNIKEHFGEKLGVDLIVKKDKQCLKVIGPSECAISAIQTINDMILAGLPDTKIVYLPQDLVEYLASFEFKDEKRCKFELRNGEYTGTIIFEGKVEDQLKMKAKIENASKGILSSWFSLSKPWLASIIENIPLQRIVRRHACMITFEIGDSLAAANVPAVSVLTGRNHVIRTRLGSIATLHVDAVAYAACPDMTAVSEVSHILIESGGRPLQVECRKYLSEHGKVAEGCVAVTKAGTLPCKGVIHAVMPQWKDGKMKDIDSLQDVVKRVLQAADRAKFYTLALPVFDLATNGYKADFVVEWTIKAVRDYLKKTLNSTIECLYLCDDSKAGVKKLQANLKIYLSDTMWFTFDHGRIDLTEARVSDTVRPTSARPTSARPTSARPTSGRPGSRTGVRSKHPLAWGLDENMPVPTHSVKFKMEQIEEDLEEEEKDDEQFKMEFADRLPYQVDLTKNTRLHIVKGSIERQKVNVIVNTTTKFPELTGAVSTAIKRVGGPTILAECRKYKAANFRPGEMYRTSAGNLPCNRVYHVILDSAWTDESYQKVCQSVRSCLVEATKFQCVSIAFPTFGTGLAKFPIDKVADAMLSSINKFVTATAVTSLKDVYVVVYYADADTVQMCEAIVPGILRTIRNKRDDASAADYGKPGPRPRQKIEYKGTKDSAKHSVADDVVLVKVTRKRSSRVDTIQQDIEKLIDEEYAVKELKITSEADEEFMSKNEETLLRSLGTQHTIVVEIDTKKKLLRLSGLVKDVRRAETRANDMLLRQFRETRIKKKMAQLVIEHVQWLYEEDQAETRANDMPLRQFRETRIKKKMAQLVIEHVQWLYEEGGVQHPVSPETNFEMHMGYLRGQDFTYRNVPEHADDPAAGTEYKVIVGKLEEHPVSDPSKKRRLYQRNKTLAGISLPAHWTIHADGKEEARVVLPPNSPEFNTVKTKFRKDGCKPISINNIIRIENRYMWQQYQSKKHQLDKQNPPGTKNERQLWHGTDENTYNVIVQKGFDRSFAGKNATAYGTGTYFATTSSYSNRYAVADRSGVQRMFLCKVLAGMFCRGDGNMNVLPNRVESNNQLICYDSAVDNVNTPSMFVIFHDTQAFPEYLIEYK